MRVRTVTLRNYRNHAQTTLACAEGVNVCVGDNGAGKTNALEGISYLCLTKSFFGSNDRTALQNGKPEFSLYGEFVSDRGITFHNQATYDSRTAQKSFSINKSPVERFSSVIGQFPVVVLSPESADITAGGPSSRRKFLDFVISQANRVYLEDLLEYRRILKQRNKILFDARILRTDATDLLGPWDESLITTGSRLMLRRRQFIEEFSSHMASAYRSLAGELEIPQLLYAPLVGNRSEGSLEDVQKEFQDELRHIQTDERHAGTTLVGPHRDEMELRLGELDLRKFASQGQHKTFLIALKVAEFFYLKERCNETPMLLLDDIFSELDPHRSARLLDLIGGLGQTFITTTSVSMFPSTYQWSGSNRKFIIRGGAVEYGKAG